MEIISIADYKRYNQFILQSISDNIPNIPAYVHTYLKEFYNFIQNLVLLRKRYGFFTESYLKMISTIKDNDILSENEIYELLESITDYYDKSALASEVYLAFAKSCNDYTAMQKKKVSAFGYITRYTCLNFKDYIDKQVRFFHRLYNEEPLKFEPQQYSWYIDYEAYLLNPNLQIDRAAKYVNYLKGKYNLPTNQIAKILHLSTLSKITHKSYEDIFLNETQ